MFAEERHNHITRLAEAAGRVSVAELAERFAITAETVRRDLATLESRQVLRRVHGGAVLAARASTAEESVRSRRLQHREEKARIARRALALVPPKGSVLLDAGTTTEQLAGLLAEQIPSAGGLMVITHSVPVAYRISGSDLPLELVGGGVRRLTSAAVGPETVARLDALRPDLAFLGANGIHATFGLSTPDSMEASVKKAIVRAARRVVALLDSSKLNEETLISFAALADIDSLITDTQPQGELAAALAEADVEVVLA